MRTGPRRTCLGCRQIRPKGALVRLARRPDGYVVTDPDGRAVGRGAYVCADAECMERAFSRGRLTHAFRAPSEVGPDLVLAIAGAGRRRAVDGRARGTVEASAHEAIDAAVRA
jgi:predicted RNA-binding protein YlxR (DUF448 family)